MEPISISPLQPTPPVKPLAPLDAAGQGPGDFMKLVGNFTREVNTLQKNAAAEVARLAEGKTDNIHQVMLALGKAETGFNYMMEVRAKLLEAYKEVMRMPV